MTAANLPDTTPPVIGTLNLSSISAATARLTWTKAADAFAVQYRVYANGALVATAARRYLKLRSLTRRRSTRSRSSKSTPPVTPRW
ncbi:hypothetical protein [Phytohabitans suffuscus]|uniref:hypothetical protein n=1 Tax=Phytohabitans suffuscus TaxID=624315 RepID=UPI001567C458|nr:hypothetical protein [Phytohabitans suffuscus]